MSFKRQRTRSNADNVDSFGLSFKALEILKEQHPTQAIANLAKAFSSHFMAASSPPEFRWTSFAPPLLEETFGKKVVWTGRTSFTVHLPGAKYTPDFMHLLEDGAVVFVEVKGSTFQPSFRDSKSKIRAAATLYPFFHWYMAFQAKGGWEFEEVKSDPNYAQFILAFANAQEEKE